MPKLKHVALTIGGVVAGLSVGLALPPGQVNDIAKIIREEGRPTVIRTYEYLERDHIYVEKSEASGEYIVLKKYLKSIPNEYDRTIEEARIKKSAGW